MARGIATAAAPEAGLTELQRALIEAVLGAMTGHPVDLSSYEALDAAGLAEVLRDRSEAFRDRIVQATLLPALVLRPLPRDVAARVREVATALEVDEGMVAVAEEFASGTLGLAAFDFERNGYSATLPDPDEAWAPSTHDPELAARWEALGDLPDGSLGRRVWELYRARGFVVPGRPGSAPPLLAQHDWVHVLADYGTTVECELEVFALIARANDDMHAFSLLAMVLSLFETGYLRSGAGLFEYDPGHLSADARVAVRLADGMRRGALCDGGVDFLRIDWFELAHHSVEEARAHFGLVPKSDLALAAGSVGPWEPGGMSPFQHAAGMALAEREGRPYDAYGACTSTTTAR